MARKTPGVGGTPTVQPPNVGGTPTVQPPGQGDPPQVFTGPGGRTIISAGVIADREARGIHEIGTLRDHVSAADLRARAELVRKSGGEVRGGKAANVHETTTRNVLGRRGLRAELAPTAGRRRLLGGPSLRGTQAVTLGGPKPKDRKATILGG